MTTTVEAKVSPFDSGTQFIDWTEANCNRCNKGVHRLNDESAWPPCELEAALTTACFDDGYIPLSIAKRIGMKEDEGRYCWPCAEVDWTSEWKAEYRRRHPEPCDHKTASVISDAEAVCTWGCGQTIAINR